MNIKVGAWGLAFAAFSALKMLAASGDGNFPISYWWGPPESHNTLSTWQTVADAGFTFAGPTRLYTTQENNLKMLDFCKQVGMAALVSDTAIRDRVVTQEGWKKALEHRVRGYRNHEALLGYYLADEPLASYFGAMSEVQEAIVGLDPTHLIYAALMPIYATPYQLQSVTYERYVREYVNHMKPAVLSWDHYPFRRQSRNYFENLDVMINHAKIHGSRPWHIIEGVGWSGKPDPTEEQLRWQIYTSLAYGVKGILYFFYWPLEGKDWEGHGIVDKNGQPRSPYYTIKRMNGELSRVGKHLLPLRSDGVYHVGALPGSAKPLPSGFLIEFPKPQELVVGYFEPESGPQFKYVMVANKYHDKAQTIIASVNEQVTDVWAVDSHSGHFEPVLLKGRQFVLNLAAGEGRLLRIQDWRQEIAFESYTEPQL
ncbi:MAG: hypothetical protein HY537_16545, partial [Deltaproteobacteria bacterium]|nr:hypothetical protein [Deltaproteobacteria bacterium]